MSVSEMSRETQKLLHFLTENENETSDVELITFFESCTKTVNLIEKSDLSSSDKEYQESVNACIKVLELCTKMVNELALFSSNETVDELLTESIRYLLLPALLGTMTIALQSKDLSERMKNVEKAEVYFKDYLFRCKNYEFTVPSLHHLSFDEEEEEGRNLTSKVSRETKINNFRRRKELEKIEALQQSKDNQREYYLTSIEKWILIAIEELENIKKEKEILQFLPRKGSSSEANIKKQPKTKNKSLTPIIITKDEVQKRVFGVGYPSLPVLTIEDFYRQRFEKVIQDHEENSRGNSLQDRAMEGYDDTDAENQLKEEKNERDDPDALYKARQWDNWKDENPRGSGNRYNKG